MLTSASVSVHLPIVHVRRNIRLLVLPADPALAIAGTASKSIPKR